MFLYIYIYIYIYIYTEDNWGTHMQLLQKIQTLIDAPEGKTMH